MVFYIVCGLLAASCAQERKEQVCNSALRRAFFPVVPWPCCPHGARLRRVGSITLALVLAVTENLLDCVLIPLVPVTMVVLLVTTGMSATEVLLNGVAIAFVMEIDDFAVDLSLSVSPPGLEPSAFCRPSIHPRLRPRRDSTRRRRR